ncbi:MAG: type II secretion system F family protein [Labilithrix sp.]|nr:type II secretion system F family protein [Labilithrix sp.]MCW5815473.1 type II secretion system F family protein [Labilithrix sp.]
MNFTQLWETKDLSVQLQGMRIGALVAMVCALMLFSYGVASTPTRIASRLGLRGLKRQRVLQQNELWAGIEPLIRWLGVRVSGIMSDSQRAELDRQIGLAGDYLGISADEYLAMTLLSGFAGGIVGAFAGYVLEMGGIIFIVGIMLGGAMPYMQISGVAQERLKNIGRGLPYVIDLMALSMGAGLDFPGAVRQVVEKNSNPNDPLVEEFTLLLQSMNLGRTRKEGLLEFARRAPIETVTEFVNSLVQAEERGNPVAEVLAIQATVSRTRRSVRAEELAAKAGVQMVGPLMLVFFCIMGLLMGPALMNIMAGL